ncbi:TonB-dependent receptor [Cellvibrio mixtus]|uniref:TonB-dependent receptor n=1 Tax=Cellvibrio mixtus TaxID=39650 RepID=A0A266Q9H8_9GAMM|nr:TonB-dependent receptor [Cellvibrio mixtus]OZY86534.1 TonB-dependent receptor [Cellvibrio mixtus]
MKHSTLFKPALLSLAVAAATAGSGTVLAQESKAQDNSNVEEVMVTGIRASLMRAQSMKMENTSISEALAAEDIGKLPDSSIAESLARLPGLAGERRGGRVSGISVRGFKEDFVGTTLNGRELLGIGDNRGAEYDLYPSEIMSGAVIYKSAEAKLTTTGIGGTVDLRTARPLDVSPTVTINGSYELNSQGSDNPEFDDNGSRYAIGFSQKFADDTIGLAMAYASTESPTNQRKYGVWGYSEDEDSGRFAPTGLDIMAISSVLERDTVSAIFQYRPNEDLDIVIDALDIDYKDYGVIRGFIEPFSIGTITPGSGTFDATGTQVNANPVLRTDPKEILGDLQTVGLNLKYKLNDVWSIHLDVADSESSKTDTRGESYAGLGRSGSLTNSQLGSRDFVMSQGGVFFTGISGMDFSDFDAIKLTGPQGWGGSLAAEADVFASNVQKAAGGGVYTYENAQDGFLNSGRFDETLTTAKFEVAATLDTNFLTGVTLGAYYSDREKSKVNDGFFATSPTYPYGNGTGVVDEVIPEKYRLGLADLTWAGLGMVVAYDGYAPYKDGYYYQTSAATLEPDRLGDTYIINEKVTTFYVQGDFNTEVNGFNVFGNAGLQVVDTDQSSSGYIGLVDETFSVDPNRTAEGGASYTKVLPSLNLSVEVAESQFVRFGASKTISRARIDQMKASGFVKYDQNIDILLSEDYTAETPWSKFQGAPTLRPFESNNLDLAYEKYFAEDGYVSVSYFYKDLVNWTREGQTVIDFTNDATNGGANYYIPAFHDKTVQTDGTYGPNDVFLTAGTVVAPAQFQGYSSSFEDGLKGKVDGWELTANVPLNLVSDMLDGFGFAASGSFIDAKLDDGSAIPGQSDEVYSLTVYYAVNGFEVRVAGTDRSDFLTYQRGGSNKIENANRKGVQLIDAQISYDFSESSITYLNGLRVSLQGTNLTDEDEEDVGEDGIVSARREFGPTYMVNVNYSF